MTATAPVSEPTATASTNSHTGDTSQRQAAKIAGVSYILLFVLAIFGNFGVREGMIESGDAAATAANITGSEGLFRLGLVSFLVIFVLDIVISWALYIFFRETNRDLSLLTAWFRLIYTVLLGVALVFFFQALQLLSGSDFLDVIPTDQLHAQALVALEMFNSTWLVGLAVFGLHLMFLGYLVIRSGLAPRGLGWIMMIAGVAYVVDTLAHSLLADYADNEALFMAMVAVPSVIGEGWFGLWLLLRAGKNER
jgi:hypothetical protein